MPQSLEAIKIALRILAKDFADRKEYNSYKHGLRVLPLTQRFQAWEPNTNKQILDLNFSDAMTFLTDTKSEFSITTRNFDTQRDYNMTNVVSQLISNIINIRKAAYSKPKEEVLVMFFEPDKIVESGKQNVSSRELKVKWKK